MATGLKKLKTLATFVIKKIQGHHYNKNLKNRNKNNAFRKPDKGLTTKGTLDVLPLGPFAGGKAGRVRVPDAKDFGFVVTAPSDSDGAGANDGS